MTNRLFTTGAMLIAMSMSIAAFADDTASDSFDFGYAGNYDTALRLNGPAPGMTVYLGFEIAAEDVERLAGNSITDVNIYGGTSQNDGNKVRNIKVFITSDLGDPMQYIQDAQLSSTAFGYNTIHLNDPYVIQEGKKVYVGYCFDYEVSQGYYLVVDGVKKDANTCLAAWEWIGYNVQENMWTNYAPEHGSLCMSVTLSGTDLPENRVSLSNFEGPMCVKLGDKVPVTAIMRNNGANDIDNIDLLVKVDGENEYEHHIDMTPALATNTTSNLSVELNPFSTEGYKNVSISVAKVNGVPNAKADACVSDHIACIEKGFPRVPVVEEATGTWCGNCPSGMVMLEYLAEKYGDKVALIAVHGGQDPLSVTSYSGFISSFVSSYPLVFLNRVDRGNPMAVSESFDAKISQQTNTPTFMQTELGELEYPEGGQNHGVFNGTVRFAVDNDRDYRVSLALVEDGLGPFNQTNYFSGKPGAPGDWGDKPSEVSMLYDDVARWLSAFPGTVLQNGPFVKDKDYNVRFDMNGLKVIKGNSFRAVMMITDAESGEILNASVKTYSRTSGIEVPDGDNVTVTGGKGCIIVSGDGDVEVSTLAGLRTGTDGLAPGIYIVRVGESVSKVIVK